MQQSWRSDADKLTFIICQPDENKQSPRDGRLDLVSMVGDANLFISTADDEDGITTMIGELELMIAEQSEQRKGYGRAALLAFLNYILYHEIDLMREFHAGQATSTPKLSSFNHFVVKIGETNYRSIALFEDLGFCKTGGIPSYFGEYELRLQRDRINLESLARKRGLLDGYRERSYSCP